MALNPLQNIVVCADDYGLTTGVNRAIEALILAGRLSATSVMVGCRAWTEGAPVLCAIVKQSRADVGLHLTLTHHEPLTSANGFSNGGRFESLGKLIMKSHRHQLSEEAIRLEIRAQLEAFEALWGAPPDYVDGHQHVHVLPIIREQLLAELASRYCGELPYVRNCYEPFARLISRGGAISKTGVISFLGKKFLHLANVSGFKTNDGFSGSYHLNQQVDFRAQMQRFLSHLGPRHLVHVHPGFVDDQLRTEDPFAEPREAERSYLESAAYLEDLAAAGVQVGCFKDLGRG